MNTVKSIVTSRTTLIAALALAIGALVVLAFLPPRVEGVAPPAAVSHRTAADGACQLSVVGFDGRTWSAEQGSEQLRQVDGVGDACTPAVVTDRVTVGGECVRVLRVDGRTYALPENDGDGPLQAAPAEATTAVTGCRTDPSR
ncbi:hypothetical protein [Mycolicibacterium fortuitum]|uniref:hypothetical protein n=1 Tax=Mycolicibacterium fortuitum TaxID=1766 RepID=UPI00262B8A6C|nr:hypothetical protein [Mycolicibacterium fortuitum]